MLNVAYIANEFPASVEPYVVEEIGELRKRGVRVVASSVKQPKTVSQEFCEIASETLYFALSVSRLLRALEISFRFRRMVLDIFKQALTKNSEPIGRRLRAVIHTLLGVYYAAILSDQQIEHIHVHHGYFAAWITMTAARLLGITYSMTLHGSDLLVHRAYLEVKLDNCKFCLTISDFNRQHILA